MARYQRHRGMPKEPPELDITTFLNLMVVLIPFLLISAVFSRITIMELEVPSGSGAGKADKPALVLEVIVRKKGIEISNGKGVVASMKKVDDKYDIKRFSDYLQKIKKNYPEKFDAIVLMEPKLEYEYLILIMDALTSVEVVSENQVPDSPVAKKKIVLFPNISVGDAP